MLTYKQFPPTPPPHPHPLYPNPLSITVIVIYCTRAGFHFPRHI